MVYEEPRRTYNTMDTQWQPTNPQQSAYPLYQSGSAYPYSSRDPSGASVASFSAPVTTDWVPALTAAMQGASSLRQYPQQYNSASTQVRLLWYLMILCKDDFLTKNEVFWQIKLLLKNWHCSGTLGINSNTTPVSQQLVNSMANHKIWLVLTRTGTQLLAFSGQTPVQMLQDSTTDSFRVQDRITEDQSVKLSNFWKTVMIKTLQMI